MSGKDPPAPQRQAGRWPPRRCRSPSGAGRTHPPLGHWGTQPTGCPPWLRLTTQCTQPRPTLGITGSELAYRPEATNPVRPARGHRGQAPSPRASGSTGVRPPAQSLLPDTAGPVPEHMSCLQGARPPARSPPGPRGKLVFSREIGGFCFSGKSLQKNPFPAEPFQWGLRPAGLPESASWT